MRKGLLDGMGPEWEWLVHSATFAVVTFVLRFAVFDRAQDSLEEAL